MTGAILRPKVNADGFDTGLYWTDAPKTKPGPKNPRLKMGLDTLVAEPLDAAAQRFVRDHWAVVQGTQARAADVFQDFDTRDVVVTAKVADVIRALEPDQHDLIEAPNTWVFGSNAACDQRLYFLNVHVTAPTVDVTQSDIYEGVRRLDNKPYKFLRAMTPKDCTVYDDAARGKHLWRDTETLAVFMSATLGTALSDAGVRGLTVMTCTQTPR